MDNYTHIKWNWYLKSIDQQDEQRSNVSKNKTKPDKTNYARTNKREQQIKRIYLQEWAQH